VTQAESSRWSIGIDTGGTFTDLVAIGPSGEILMRKVSSTPDQPSAASLQALDRTGLDLPHDVSYLVLGTTIATNAVIQRKGVPTILVTTAGFEDILWIQRIDRRGQYDLQWVKAEPYVSRADVIGVRERVIWDGSVRVELTDEEIERIVRVTRERIGNRDAAIAVAFLFSYVNADHERRLAARLREALPDTPVSVSHEVAPIWREYERTSTTVMDAYVKPIVKRFCETYEAGLQARSVGGWHGLLKSNGGGVPVAHAADRAIEIMLSGLAGGMLGGAYWARAVGSKRAVTLDMGGTSADVGVVVNGELHVTGSFDVEWGVPAALPLIDVTTIGAGGSSVASIDKTGLLRVGPESVGADPGPACYGKGGDQPTVTDANLVTGRLDPNYFLGGEMALDSAKAEAAVATIGRALGIATPDAASAIISVSVENMVGAVRLVTVDRGYDYRDFDLVAFGGAGPLHGAEIVRRMGMRQLVVPPSPGLSSALGAVIADHRVDRRATLVRRLNRADAADVPVELARVAEEARAELARQYGERLAGGLTITTYVACRYLGQNYEQEVRTFQGPVDRTADLAAQIAPSTASFLERLAAGFHELHERAYRYSLPDATIQTIYLGATASLPGLSVTVEPYSPSRDAPPPSTTRRVFVGDGVWSDAAIFNRHDLPPGFSVVGPAIIEEVDSTTYVPPDFEARVDPTYCLHLTPVRPKE
jgi:N-methylhydantoinase A